MTPQQLPELPADQLLAGQERVIRSLGLGSFSPYIDGKTISELPIDSVRAGRGVSVPTLLGSNRDEWALFDLFVPGSTALVIAQLRGRFGNAVDTMQ